MDAQQVPLGLFTSLEEEDDIQMIEPGESVTQATLSELSTLFIVWTTSGERGSEVGRPGWFEYGERKVVAW